LVHGGNLVELVPKEKKAELRRQQEALEQRRFPKYPPLSSDFSKSKARTAGLTAIQKMRHAREAGKKLDWAEVQEELTLLFSSADEMDQARALYFATELANDKTPIRDFLLSEIDAMAFDSRRNSKIRQESAAARMSIGTEAERLFVLKRPPFETRISTAVRRGLIEGLGGFKSERAKAAAALERLAARAEDTSTVVLALQQAKKLEDPGKTAAENLMTTLVQRFERSAAQSDAEAADTIRQVAELIQFEDRGLRDAILSRYFEAIQKGRAFERLTGDIGSGDPAKVSRAFTALEGYSSALGGGKNDTPYPLYLSLQTRLLEGIPEARLDDAITALLPPAPDIASRPQAITPYLTALKEKFGDLPPHSPVRRRIWERAKAALTEGIRRGTTSEDNGTLTATLHGIEQVRDGLPEGVRPDYARAVNETLRAPDASNEDLCKIVCDVVKAREKWSAAGALHNQPEWEETAHSWGFATRSLSALLMVKAAPYCAEARGQLDSILGQVFRGPPKPDAEKLARAHKESLEFLSGALAAAGGEKEAQAAAQRFLDQAVGDSLPKEFSMPWGKSFYLLLTRELERNGALFGREVDALRATAAKMESSLESDLNTFDRILHTDWDGANGRVPSPSTANGSLMNHFALAATALAHPQTPKGVLVHFDEARKRAGGPTNFGYDGRSDRDGDLGAASRSVLIQYLRFREAPSHLRPALRAELVAALENFNVWLPTLKGHAKGAGTHKGAENIAPYNFVGVSWAIPILTELAEEGGPDADRLKTLRQLAVNEVLDVKKKNEATFQAYGDDWRSSQVFVNPLYALALLPAISQCDGKPVAVRSTGILETPAKKPAVAKAPKPAETINQFVRTGRTEPVFQRLDHEAPTRGKVKQ